MFNKAYMVDIMRFLVFIFIATLCINPAFAQNDAASNEPTDAQIREAQTYYKYCDTNETLKKIRDCQCSAAQYLDARVKMGNSVPQSSILDAIKGMCSLDEKRYGDSDNATQKDDFVSQLTEAELKEAEQVYKTCEEGYYTRTYQDCECLAGKFIEARQEMGPLENANNIMLKLRDECKNPVNAIGAQYTSCMANDRLDNLEINVPRKTFCECAARAWVDMYENYNGKLSARVISNFGSGAISRCLGKFR
tara:strand:+ start:753 stop:1502 length:750 start_codon:yes stop_codon:yes gene_type:complete